MHTVDESSEPTVSFVELSASKASRRDSALESDLKSPSPQIGNRTIAFDQILQPSKTNSKTLFGTGIAATAAPEVPVWKRVLDISCILLSMPFWLPVMFLLAVWVKLVSQGPIF